MRFDYDLEAYKPRYANPQGDVILAHTTEIGFANILKEQYPADFEFLEKQKPLPFEIEGSDGPHTVEKITIVKGVNAIGGKKLLSSMMSYIEQDVFTREMWNASMSFSSDDDILHGILKSIGHTLESVEAHSK